MMQANLSDEIQNSSSGNLDFPLNLLETATSNDEQNAQSPMQSDKNNVYKSYDSIAEWYFANRDQDLMEKPYLDEVIGMIGPGSKILDLGCGTGLPIMKYLGSQGLQVTGADASIKMLEIARKNLPEASFLHVDMRQLNTSQQYDAIVAWNSFFHLPPEDQPAMFNIFQTHLKPKGVLLFTSGTQYGEAWGMNGGINLYHGSLSTAAYREHLENNGFKVIRYQQDDPNCGHFNIWLAQKQNHDLPDQDLTK